MQIRAGGFYTEEIREGRVRTGFRIVTLDGDRAVLAHVGIRGQPRIGKYGVDLEALNAVGVKSVEVALTQRELVIVDEIGPMELLSNRFQEAVLVAMESLVPVLGTIMSRSSPFADRIKALPQVQLLHLSRTNREEVAAEIVGRLRSMLRSSRGTSH